MGDGITDFLQENANASKSLLSTIVSESLGAGGQALGRGVAGKVAGGLVEPALWAVSDDGPDAVDVGLWGMGLLGGPLAIAGAVTGLLRGVVDDQVQIGVDQAAACEPERYRKGIKSCHRYGSAGAFTNAMSIAAAGGTAWEHPNGTWVYIVDAKKRLVCDYQPAVAKRIFQPNLPLQPVPGGFKWSTVRG